MCGDLVYKTAGRKVPAGRGIAIAMRNVFAVQSQVENPTTFRHWDKRLAAALLEPVLNIMMREARAELRERGARVDSTKLAADLRSAAMRRVTAVAASINDTTLDMNLLEGEPFATSRIAQIALTEANWASNEARALAGRAAGAKYLVWRTRSNACPKCKDLEGKRVRFGKDFVAKDGTRISKPPLHPNCYCVVEIE
jgi:hypothetical protein